jgi:hypothetical protein
VLVLKQSDVLRRPEPHPLGLIHKLEKEVGKVAQQWLVAYQSIYRQFERERPGQKQEHRFQLC